MLDLLFYDIELSDSDFSKEEDGGDASYLIDRPAKRSVVNNKLTVGPREQQCWAEVNNGGCGKKS